MKFASIRLVTEQFEALLAFYRNLSEIEPVRLADGFAEVRFEGVVLAISAQQLVARFNAGAAIAAANRSAILEFQVADVKSVRSRLVQENVEIVMPPHAHAVGESVAAGSRPGWEPGQRLFEA